MTWRRYRQIIIWSNDDYDDPVQWHIYASPSLNELIGRGTYKKNINALWPSDARGVINLDPNYFRQYSNFTNPRMHLFHTHTMLHSEQKCAHFCSEWSIVGYGKGACWDLKIRSIVCCLFHAKSWSEPTMTHHKSHFFKNNLRVQRNTIQCGANLTRSILSQILMIDAP